MKKIFIAQWMACAGTWGSVACAQSAVSIYGMLDASIERLVNVAGGGSVTRMPGLTGSMPSLLGFRGAEDLGGGLKAVFTLESGFGVDAGTFNQGGRVFGRQAFLGLSGDWGMLSLGRQYSMLFWSQMNIDMLGPNAYGMAALDSYIPNARADNSMAYRGKFGGWSAGATYSFGRDAVNAGPSPAGTNCPGESANGTGICRQWSAMLRYDDVAWGAALGVDQIRGGPGAFGGLTSSDKKAQRSVAAAWVKFSDLKIGGGVIARVDDGTSATLGRSSKLWYMNAAYSVSPQLVVDGGIFRLDYARSDNLATLYALRATHALSRRTSLYVTAGHIRNKGVLALSVSAAAIGNGPVAGASQTGVTAGIRHAF